MRKPKYRLSPNEVERLVKEERERLRKLRIVQVREQAKANAAVIRNQVKNEKERLLVDFANEVKNEVLAEKEEKVRKLEQKYDSTLRSIGEGHAEVLLHGDGQKIAERLHKRLEDEEKAVERFNVALEKQDKEKAQEEWEASRNIRNRNLALEAESKRSAYIAALPPPASDDISFSDKPTQKKAIPMTDMKSFATTHYHIPDFQVVKAGPDEQIYDAKAQADQADQRLKQDLKEKKRSQHEQVEKARIRGNEALQKEMLKHDLSDMMKDLSLLQRKDRRRRQALLADVPSQVFVPPERCLQDRADQQLEMERHFEEMYINKQQKPDASTLQTWSELPTTGEDAASTIGGESEMSTLESVPLPPSEMALRDVKVASKKSEEDQKLGSSRKQDTVLKQLLSKIKEQRLNAVLANQKQDSARTLTNERPGKESDAASLTSASESRASWKRSTEYIDEDSQEDIPILKGHGMHQMIPVDGRSEDSGDSKSSGSKILHQNSAMIEELQQRIQKIENQKVNLAQQLHNQSEFYRELQKQQQGLQNLKLFPQQSQQHGSMKPLDSYYNYDDEHEPTLEDVSIPSRAGSQHNITDSDFNPSPPQIATTTTYQQNPRNRNVKFLPPTTTAEFDHRADLANAASRLRPVAGILKGTVNPQFELLASNGFLPSPMENDNNRESVTGQGGNYDGQTKNDADVDALNEKNKNIFQLDNFNLVKEGSGGARRMIDFSGGGGGELKKTDAFITDCNNILSSQSDKSDYLSNVLHKLTTDTDSGQGFSNDNKIAMGDDPIRKKIQDYHSRAQEFHASMDESTLNKVRDYQQHILQTHQDRKHLLDSIRNDIEERRKALYTTSKFVGTGGAFLMNLGGATSGVGVGGQMSSSYPMLSSAGFDSRQFLTHSQSERVLEPIKPFKADPWNCNKKQSILKPSSDFQAQYDLSKVGDGENRNGEGAGMKAPRSIEKIKKSLAFDDLNESNADASPAFIKVGGGGGDSLNDTSTSRHSQAVTDDSKLTTSEEDRGSPILQGSRSDHWDTSDNRSNNSVTGSSSLNGSALVARAEERRDGFERRQQELRNQLMDIQHQKESILMRYYKGQQVIQQQQNVLRHKLLFTDAANRSLGQATESESKSFLTDSDTGVDEDHHMIKSTTSGGGGRVGQASTSALSDFNLQPSENLLSKLSRYQGSGSNGSSTNSGGLGGNDRLSGKSSKSSRSSGSGVGESLNLTRDDYLEEISYHRVKGTDEPTKPLVLPAPETGVTTSWSSLGQNQKRTISGPGASFVEGSRASAVAAGSSGFTAGGYGQISYNRSEEDDDDDETHLKDTGGAGGFSTWASLLSSNKTTPSSLSSSTLPMSSYMTQSWNVQGQGRDGRDEMTSLMEGGDRTLDEPSMTPHTSSELESESSQQTPERNLYLYQQQQQSHHPHELSTIMEVDTPTATESLAGSSVRLAGPGPLSASQSIQSLYSQTSGAPYQHHQHQHQQQQQHHRSLDSDESGGSGSGFGDNSNNGSKDNVVVDSFPDLPQVLPVTLSGISSSSSSLMTSSSTYPGHGTIYSNNNGRQREFNLATAGGVDGISSLPVGYLGFDKDDDDDNDGSGGAGYDYTLESEPIDGESVTNTSGGFNLSQ